MQAKQHILFINQYLNRLFPEKGVKRYYVYNIWPTIHTQNHFLKMPYECPIPRFSVFPSNCLTFETKNCVPAVYIKENSLLARLAAMKLGGSRMAIVFGRTIHLHGVAAADFMANKKWLCHELRHVEQYEEAGTLKFLYRYLAESLRKGYHHNRYEQEARQSENDQRLLDKYQLSIL